MLLLFFVSPFLIDKMFPLRTFFLWGKTHKKKLLGTRLGEYGGKCTGSCFFWSKTSEHSALGGQIHLKVTHHGMGKHTERVLKKNSLTQNAASHNNASKHTQTDGFLEHSHSKGSLYYNGHDLQ